MKFDYSRDFFEAGFPLQLFGEGEILAGDPIMGKIDINAKKAIFCADTSGNIYAVTGNGEGIFYENNYQIKKSAIPGAIQISLGDLNSDENADRFIATGSSGQIELYQFTDIGSDSLIDTVKTGMYNEQFTTKPVAHNAYFFIGTSSGKVLRFSLSNGELDSTFHFSGSINSFTVLNDSEFRVVLQSEGQNDMPLFVIDLNGDNSYETVSMPSSDRLVIEAENQPLTVTFESNAVSSPAFADINRDGLYEVILNFSDKVDALNYNGSRVSNFPVSPLLSVGEQLTGTALIFDADGDEINDVVLVSSSGQLFVYDTDGKLLNGFPTSLGGEVNTSALAEDLDDDNKIELYAVNKSGQIFAWQLDTPSDQTILWWQQTSFDATHNRYIQKSLEPVISDVTSLMPSQSVFNYPNPNTQNFTTIRYFLKETASVEIKIFDLAGDLVTSFSGPGQGNIHNEKRWDLTGVSSGVYLCRVEATSASETSVEIIKIMVIN
jgi:hypothetical protein